MDTHKWVRRGCPCNTLTHIGHSSQNYLKKAKMTTHTAAPAPNTGMGQPKARVQMKPVGHDWVKEHEAPCWNNGGGN